MAALQTDNDVAKLLIDAISKNRGKAACMSLTRIALEEPTSARGAHALSRLKQYDQTFMVPELLNLLSTPVETRLQYGFNGRGELMLDRIMFRETNHRRELVQLQRIVRTNEMGANVEFAFRRAGGARVQASAGQAPLCKRWLMNRRPTAWQRTINRDWNGKLPKRMNVKKNCRTEPA